MIAWVPVGCGMTMMALGMGGRRWRCGAFGGGLQRKLYVTAFVFAWKRSRSGAGGLDHLYECGAGFERGGDLVGEGDAGAFEAFVGFEAEVEAETVDGGHGGFGGFDLGVGAGEEDHGVLMVGVHVIEDSSGEVGEGIGMGVGVVGGLDPAHDAEAADEVEIEDVHAEEGEVGEVDPVFAAFVAGEVEIADEGLVGIGDLGDVADEGDAGGSEGVAVGGGLGDEEAGAWVGLEVLGVHGHVADEEDGAAGGVEGVGHEGAEGEAGLLTREGGEGGDGVEMEEGAGALGVGGFGDDGEGGAGVGVLAWGGGHEGLFRLDVFRGWGG